MLPVVNAAIAPGGDGENMKGTIHNLNDKYRCEQLPESNRYVIQIWDRDHWQGFAVTSGFRNGKDRKLAEGIVDEANRGDAAKRAPK